MIARAQRVHRPAPFTKKWSFEEKESILDYLHGDIDAEEVKACCYYEYARASEILRKAWREYDPAQPHNSSLTISRYFPWALAAQRFCFLQCTNFPNSAWRDLSKEEREHIGPLFKAVSPSPIITDVRMLNALRIFDRFKQQADEKPLGGHCPAIVGDDAVKHLVITVDYRDGEPVVKEQFARWLASEGNRKLFKEYHKKQIHKQNPDSPDRYKELLKFLAAWRLCDEFRRELGDKRGLNAAKVWTSQNRRQEAQHPKARAFFREKPEQTTEAQKARFGRQFFGPLYRDSRDWEAAIDKAKDFLEREIEVGELAERGMT